MRRPKCFLPYFESASKEVLRAFICSAMGIHDSKVMNYSGSRRVFEQTHATPYGKCSRQERHGGCVIANCNIELGDVIQTYGDVDIVWSKNFFSDCKRANICRS